MTSRLISFVVAGSMFVAAGCGDGQLDAGNPGSGGGAGTAGGSGGTAGASGTGGAAGAAGASGATGHPGAGIDAWIAFDSDRADFNRDIYRMRPDGTGMVRLTTDVSIDKEPAFAPGNARLAFTSNRSGTFQVYLLDLGTGAVTQVTRRTEVCDQPRFSHDGQWIAFHSVASVYIIHPDGTGERVVATGLNELNAYSWPDFAPGDAELVFDRSNEIDAAGLDGAGFHQIVKNWSTVIKSPSVSPAGDEIAYHVWCDGENAVSSIWTTPYSITTDPCKGRRVTPVGDPASERPAWGPSNLFAYQRVDKSTNVGSIMLIARAGGPPFLLTPDTLDSVAADNRNPTWSR